MVEQAKLGDREAFTRLAFELSDHLFAVAHRILRDFDAAGDALQVTLLRIWRDLPSLRDPDRFEAWAYRVLLRACKDQLRRQNRQPRTLHLLAADAIAADPALAIVNREQLDRAFRTLTTAIVLQYYRDMSLPQIAEVLQVPIGTVRSRLHYAKRALRSAIDADSRPTTREGRTA